jgi:signal transduction histidine kinase
VTDEQLLASALVHSTESVSIYLLDSTVRFMNAATERMMGVKFVDLAGKRLFEEYPDAVGNPFHTAFQRAATTGEPQQFEHYYPPFEGWYTGRAIRVGEHIHIYARETTEEIRHRRRLDALSRISDVLTRDELDVRGTAQAVAQTVTDIIDAECSLALLSRDHSTLDVVARTSRDPQMLELMRGVQRWDAASGHPAQALRTHQPVLAQADELARAAATVTDPAVREVIERYAPTSLVVAPLILSDCPVGVLMMTRRGGNPLTRHDCTLLADVSPSVALYLALASRRAEAHRARREAEDANRAKDQFLAMLGHELRNPLAPLVTALELMRMRSPDLLARERAVIERQVDHLSRLVDDLLDVSRITRGKVDLRRERVTLNSIVAKAIEQTSPLFEQQRHRLTVDIASDLYIYGDPTRLAQIVANLLSNAAKYTQKDGAVEVFGSRHRGNIELTVRDNGIGIDAEMLPQVFELFMQAPQPSARTRGGLGLGLTIVKSLVEMHGGEVLAKSDGKGKGSVFTIRIPETTEPVAVTQPELVPDLPRATTARRILVVDDNEDAAKLLAEVLVAHGHHIRTALDGPSALRIAEEFQPEVAVLDIGLPVMDGYELAERMRAVPRLSDLRMIAVTGYGQESDRERALGAGFAAHLAKPVAIDTLVRLVDGTD